MQVTAQEISLYLNGTLEGNPQAIIQRPARIEEARSGDICFLANPKYHSFAYTTQASVLLVSKDFKPEKPLNPTLIRVDDVYSCVSLLLEKFGQPVPQTSGVDAQAFAHASVKMAENVSVGAFSYISEDVQIGRDTVIYPQVFIGKKVKIGRGVVLHPGVRIYRDCVIGDGCIVHANAVIGSDGFGFAPQGDGTYKKIPQIGNVVLGKDVEIGSNTVIDRATMGSTHIKDGAKLDNLIQIAHNVEVGENTAIAAQAGIAGSTKVGKNCLIGGQAGFVGHITVADGTKVQAQSGISRSLTKPGAAWHGSPAFNYSEFMRSQVVFKNLPDLAKKVHELEKTIAKLQCDNDAMR